FQNGGGPAVDGTRLRTRKLQLEMRLEIPAARLHHPVEPAELVTDLQKSSLRLTGKAVELPAQDLHRETDRRRRRSELVGQHLQREETLIGLLFTGGGAPEHAVQLKEREKQKAKCEETRRRPNRRQMFPRILRPANIAFPKGAAG